MTRARAHQGRPIRRRAPRQRYRRQRRTTATRKAKCGRRRRRPPSTATRPTRPSLNRRLTLNNPPLRRCDTRAARAPSSRAACLTRVCRVWARAMVPVRPRECIRPTKRRGNTCNPAPRRRPSRRAGRSRRLRSNGGPTSPSELPVTQRRETPNGWTSEAAAGQQADGVSPQGLDNPLLMPNAGCSILEYHDFLCEISKSYPVVDLLFARRQSP